MKTINLIIKNKWQIWRIKDKGKVVGFFGLNFGKKKNDN